jgi:predicted permease
MLQASAGLESLGAYRDFGGTIVDPERAAVRVSVAALTPEVLPLLRVTPAVGRIPAVEEADATVLLGYDIWMEAFDGDPAALGRTVELNGEQRVVVGVFSEGFGFPLNHNTWVLLPPDPLDTAPVELVGRLAADATLESAESELASRWTQFDALRGEEARGAIFQLRSFTGGRGEGGEAVAFIGLVLVALALLLIACANVANLLLVRATERVRALGIQSALGASRSQIAAQLFLEALMLAAMGGVAGLFLADLGVDAIERTLAAEHWGYFWMRMAVDGRVVAFAGVLVAGTALVAGTLPVLRVWRVDVQQVLKEEGSASSVGGGGAWGRAFVTAQLGLSCAALVAAGLAAQSLGASRTIGRDLPMEEVLATTVDLGTARAEPDQVAALLEARVAAIPAVTSTALALGAPAYLEPSGRFEFAGVAYDRPEDRESTGYNAVTSGFFGMFDIELRAGRSLEAADAAGTATVAVVNESFARRFSPDQSVMGRRVRFTEVDAEQWYTVVGVVEDVDVGGGELVSLSRVYFPLAQVAAPNALLLARTRGGDGAALTTPLREAVAEVDPALALWRIRTLADSYAYLIRVPRAMAAIALGGGMAGLLVAAVGLYGLLAFRVRQRRRELGVQLALGADGRRLAIQTLDSALRQVLPALAFGLTVAWLAAPILSVLLLGTDPRSLGTYVGVAASFLAVSLVAAAIPAIRASRVDPARVLRGD